ncbi:four helix bundle protein [bacterium]|nr:four helix bundle protein [bacterium]
MEFSFEKLTVYQKSLCWIDFSENILNDRKRKITAAQRDQLSRAAMSISLNIAEANGRWHKAEKRNLLLAARGSVFECAALLQILLRRSKITSEEYEHLFPALGEIGKMLSALIRSTEELASSYPR